MQDGSQVTGIELLSIPLIVLIARFPMLLDAGDGGIEVGFDSCVLMFLLATLPPEEALVLWSLGILATQLISDKRSESKRFNIGIGILSGAVSTMIMTNLRGDALGTPRELMAVALAAAGYFAIDFLLSAVSVSLEGHTSVRRQLVQPGTAIAVACFVPFDLLGYLGAVVSRSSPWWTLALFAVPLATLLLATRAVTRGRENARRLGVLLEAASRAQTLSGTRQVVDALIDDAGRLLRLRNVEVRSASPGPHEIGARLREGQRDRWIVASAQDRARSTSAADQKALEAMSAVSSDAFARLELTEDMTHLARHDLLTNLPNRGLLLDRLEHALQLSLRRGSRIALLFCDLDGFKPVNDRFGHAAGDAVLIDVAQRLIASVRESDTVARLGGDEFAILLEDVRPNQVGSTCERILEALRPGVIVDGHQVPLSISIGVAPGDTGNSAEHLLRNADMAMYEAKALGQRPVRAVRGVSGPVPCEASGADGVATGRRCGRSPEPGLSTCGDCGNREDHWGGGTRSVDIERRERSTGPLHRSRRGERAHYRSGGSGSRLGRRRYRAIARGSGRPLEHRCQHLRTAAAQSSLRREGHGHHGEHEGRRSRVGDHRTRQCRSRSRITPRDDATVRAGRRVRYR